MNDPVAFQGDVSQLALSQKALFSSDSTLLKHFSLSHLQCASESNKILLFHKQSGTFLADRNEGALGTSHHGQRRSVAPPVEFPDFISFYLEGSR